MENLSFKGTYTVLIVRHRAMENLSFKGTYRCYSYSETQSNGKS